MCSAHAIVTIKARVDKHLQYQNVMQGCGLQGFLAGKLHQEAGVPESLCGGEELKKFQASLGSEYQLIVVEGMKGQILF